jgi:Zn-dependent protease with chaperone function
MTFFLSMAMATLSFAVQSNVQLDNYYSLETEAEAGERFVTLFQAKVNAAPEPRLDHIGGRLAPHIPDFHYRWLVFDGGQTSQDTAPAAAFPADWRRLELEEAIAVAGGTIFLPRRLLARDEAQLTAILAHAMGHIALRHPTVAMTRGELAQVEVQAASRSLPDEAPQRVRAVALKRFAFDRACETAADEFAASLLHKAGIDPASLVEYLQALPVPQKEPFAVHPTPAERIEAVRAFIAGLKP